MASRARVVDAGGILAFDDAVAAPVKARPALGERLRAALAELDERQGEEARRRSEQRRALGEEIRGLREQSKELYERAQELRRKAEEAQGRLDLLPDEGAGRSQLVIDRLSALGRVLRAEVHALNDMLDAYATYRDAWSRWDAELTARPDLDEARRLVEFHSASPAEIAELPDVLRTIVERQLASAQAALDELGEPQRPAEVAPVYECVSPAPGGGSVVAVVIPGSCDAMRGGHPHASFVAELLAAVSQALLEGTDADAPVVICPDTDDPLRGAVVVGATCTTDALDAELFGVRLQELLSESRLVGVEVHSIDDADLAGGLADLVRARVEAR